MCGISYLINLNQKFPIKDLEWMNKLIFNRGPDFQSIEIIDNVGLGHTRLFIMDLLEKGDQPFSYLDAYTIVFNGEIYDNLKYVLDNVNLIKKFATKGYKFAINNFEYSKARKHFDLIFSEAEL